jgi:hypothetical protein
MTNPEEPNPFTAGDLEYDEAHPEDGPEREPAEPAGDLSYDDVHDYLNEVTDSSGRTAPP